MKAKSLREWNRLEYYNLRNVRKLSGLFVAIDDLPRRLQKKFLPKRK